MTQRPARPAAGTPSVPLPRTLLLAAVLAGLEGLVLLGYGVLELVHTSADRIALGLTTTVFFLGYGAGLVACAVGLTRRATWARAPVVLAQLIQLGVAWSFRGGSTTPVAVALAVVAVAVLACVLTPASTEALLDDPEREDLAD